MDFEPDDTQTAVLTGLDQLIASLGIDTPIEPSFSEFSPQLDAELQASGFLDIAREEEFSVLEAALIVERVARLPRSAEAAASALIGPLFEAGEVARPLALARGSALAPARFLPQAGTLIVDAGDSLQLVGVNRDRVERMDTLFAYPYGKLASLDGLAVRTVTGGIVGDVRRRWRLAIAAESAGLMQSALDTVVEHVKTRHQFGRPLGSFQAIQHRLAAAASTSNATRLLALGMEITDVQRFLGHEDIATTRRYAETTAAVLRRRFDQLTDPMADRLVAAVQHRRGD